jgi:murein DD-endopeptidase MepM/ murein hydrolase activator NlpD
MTVRACGQSSKHPAERRRVHCHMAIAHSGRRAFGSGSTPVICPISISRHRPVTSDAMFRRGRSRRPAPLARALVAASAFLAATVSVSAVGASGPASDTRSSPATRISACPVQGPSQFDDSWGAARSGGRRHAGVDMAAARGTPIVAVVDGYAEFKRSNLGGNAIWLTDRAGQRFYYAHLDAWNGQSRNVSAGDIIGYVGSTGNAKGNHLHLEAYAGEESTNPFPVVFGACVPPRPIADDAPHTVMQNRPH